jgi:hypothetical protein
LSWREVLFGIDQELLDPSAPTAIAVAKVEEGCVDDTVLELAGLSTGDDARQYLAALAAREPDQSLHDIRSQWLCITLSWLYAHRDEYDDPLREVEKVYADFDYPEDMKRFVRYMPMEEVDLGSRELNEARLYHKWSDFVRECSQRLGQRREHGRP